ETVARHRGGLRKVLIAKCFRKRLLPSGAEGHRFESCRARQPSLAHGNGSGSFGWQATRRLSAVALAEADQDAATTIPPSPRCYDCHVCLRRSVRRDADEPVGSRAAVTDRRRTVGTRGGDPTPQ